MSLITSKVLHALAHAPRPVLMSIPMIGVVVISAGLLLLAHESGRVAEWQLARQQGPAALAQAHDTSAAGTPQP